MKTDWSSSCEQEQDGVHGPVLTCHDICAPDYSAPGNFWVVFIPLSTYSTAHLPSYLPMKALWCPPPPKY